MPDPRQPATPISPPIRAVVADDEPASREAVLTMLAEHRGIEIVGEATNGRDAVEVVRQTRPDLLFLDIQMPDLDGFNVLESLGADVPRGVVFVTAHDEHAIRAFEVHALDYVLKPFGRSRFGAAVARAVERLSALDALTLQRTLASMANDRLEAREPVGDLALDEPEHPLPEHPQPEHPQPEHPQAEHSQPEHAHPVHPHAERTRADADPPAIRAFRPPKRLGVRTGSKTLLIDVDAIDWVEALGDYARIHVGAKVHVVTQRMHTLERVLDASRFVRIHRSSIVNIERVQIMHREADGSGTIVLANGVRLRVARGRWEVLVAALNVEHC